jgi:lipopolysaccharide export system permease protein
MIDPFYSFNSLKKKDTTVIAAADQKNLLNNFDPERRKYILLSALAAVRNAKDFTTNALNDLDAREKNLYRNQIEWHRKFTLSFACLVLFFIGAPLGAIIRKGGLGMPVVVSVLLFLVFHIISITGEKFVREGVLPAYKGMWISSIVLFPVGVFLTYKATTDSRLFDIDAYKKFFSFFSKRKELKTP